MIWVVSQLFQELTELDEHQRIEAQGGSSIGPSVMQTICAFANEASSGRNTYYKASLALLNDRNPTLNRLGLSVNSPNLTANEPEFATNKQELTCNTQELISNTQELPQFLQEITEKGKTWLKHEGKS